MGLQFHETVRGARFYDHDVPKLIKGINRLAEAIEESNRLRQEAIAGSKDSEPDAGKPKDTYFCYTAFQRGNYAVKTFCEGPREVIMWANTQIEGAINEGFELANPFGAEREFFGAIPTEKKAEISLKHSDGRVRYIGFERE